MADWLPPEQRVLVDALRDGTLEPTVTYRPNRHAQGFFSLKPADHYGDETPLDGEYHFDGAHYSITDHYAQWRDLLREYNPHHVWLRVPTDRDTPPEGGRTL